MTASLSQRKLHPAWLLLVALAPAFAPTRPVDLDVAIPPGSPLEWGGAFPGYTPRDLPLFPRTRESEPEPQRTRAGGAGGAVAGESDVRFAQSFSLLRVLTWDLTSHLTWITRPPRGPVSRGEYGRPPPPRHGDPLYWVGLAPLLRLMLHPEVTHASETMAHLVELGDPLHPVLAAAAAEASLARYVARLGELMPDGGSLPQLEFEGSARTRVLSRFTLEECLREEPYDPVGEFGKRLFLFHEDVEPILESFSRHPSLALRRNAVAALARFRTRTAATTLARVAAEERDPVTLLRALAALSTYRGKLDEAPLLARAREEKDPVLLAAWIGALGRMGARSAVPWLIESGEQALARRNSEQLLSVLAALARIPPTAERARVLALAAEVRAEVRADSSPWKAPGPRSSEGADVPDASDARARWLAQLATLASAMADPLAPGSAPALLALAGPGARDARQESGESGLDPLAGLAPAVRVLYLDVLSNLGEAGHERLAALALDPGLEAALRGRALALAPYDRRATLATRLAEPEQREELRIQGLEVLRLDRRGELVPRTTQLLAELVAADSLQVPAGQRYLWTLALRARPASAPIDRADMLALWRALRASPALQRSLRQRAAARLEVIVQAALEGARGQELEDDVRAWLELAAPLAPERDARAAKEAHETMLELLRNARKHRGEEGYVEEVVRNLLLEHTGQAPPPVARGGHFEPSVPLEEELILTLGRSRDPAALELLLQLLALSENDFRGEVALALALSGERAVAVELAALLLDADPFVRLCAGEGLRALLELELDHDWVHGPETERRERALALAAKLSGR